MPQNFNIVFGQLSCCNGKPRKGKSEGGGRGEKFYFNLRGHERMRTSAAYLIAQIHLNTHTRRHTQGRQKHTQAVTHSHPHTTRLCHLWFRICAYLDFSRTAGRLCMCACATRPKQFVANYTALPSIVANSFVCQCVCVCVSVAITAPNGWHT